MDPTGRSPWAVLGVDERATLAEVQHAFRTQAKQTHPDHGGGLPDPKVPHRHGRRTVDVPPRVVAQQVADGLDAEGLGQDLVGWRSLRPRADPAVRQAGVDLGDRAGQREKGHSTPTR